MASSTAHVWLEQAESDFLASSILLEQARKEKDHSVLYCQVAAKCQQVVEKGVKAIVAELDYTKRVSQPIRTTHPVDTYIKNILRNPSKPDEDLSIIQQTLRRNRAEIDGIMALAPHGRNGQLLPRNTEYPFHNYSEEIVAPASPNAFHLDEVEGYYRLASAILKRAKASVTISNRSLTNLLSS